MRSSVDYGAISSSHHRFQVFRGGHFVRLFSILCHHILQKCCTCRNNPHPRTHICLSSVAGPKGHWVCLQDCSCIQREYWNNSQVRFLSHFFLMFHLSSFATLQIVFLHYVLSLVALRRCLGTGHQASILYKFFCTMLFFA